MSQHTTNATSVFPALSLPPSETPATEAPSPSLPPGIEIRPLRPEEFHLAAGPEEVIWPPSAVILGAWRGEKLVARLGVILLPHLEGLWVDEEERTTGGAIAKELHREVEQASASLGCPSIFAYVPHSLPGMATYLNKSGYEKLDISIYGKNLLNPSSEE